LGFAVKEANSNQPGKNFFMSGLTLVPIAYESCNCQKEACLSGLFCSFSKWPILPFLQHHQSGLAIADLTKGSGHFNFVNSVLITAIGLGASFSNAVAGFIASRYTFVTAFLFLAAVVVIALLLFIFSMKETVQLGKDATPPTKCVELDEGGHLLTNSVKNEQPSFKKSHNNRFSIHNEFLYPR
jgi:hypothetical protein